MNSATPKGPEVSPASSAYTKGLLHFPNSRDMVIIMFGHEVQMVHEPHWFFQARVRY